MSEGREPAPPSGSRPRPSGKALVESTVKPTEENSRVSQQQFEAPPSEIKVERLSPPPATQPEPDPTGDTEAPSASIELSDAAATPPRSKPTAAESSVRVDVGLLGSILDLVG